MFSRPALIAAVATVTVALLAATPAAADLGHGLAGRFASGLAHPLHGIEHVIALVCIGIWAAFLGGPAIFVLPAAFAVSMALGGILGIVGVALPFIEAGILAVAVFFGLMIAIAVRPPLWVATAIIAALAAIFGNAHGGMFEHGAEMFAFGAGLVAVSVVLQVAGIAVGLLGMSHTGRLAVRAGGAAIATVSLVLMAS